MGSDRNVPGLIWSMGAALFPSMSSCKRELYERASTVQRS
jgi:hypothetical protein